MVFSFLTRVGLRASIAAPAPASVAQQMLQVSAAVATPKRCDSRLVDKPKDSIAQLFVLSTIFSTMIIRPESNAPAVRPSTEATLTSVPPLPSTSHVLVPGAEPEPKRKKSELLEAFQDLWHSIFDWTFLMLIITPKPNIRTINKHRRRKSAQSPGFSVQVFHLFPVARQLIISGVTKGFAIVRIPFSSKPNARGPLLPRFVPPPHPSSSSSFSAPNSSCDTIPTPTRAVLSNYRVPEPVPESHRPRSTSPITAHIIATLHDLEAQMHAHRFYDLERELEVMDDHMAKVFDFPWMSGISGPTNVAADLSTPGSPESLVPVAPPQVPPPARRDGKTIQILPRISEVSESSPDLARTPPYDPTNWSIITFQPLWGPRSQVGAAY